MATFKLETPVAFIIFNRPDTTEQVFSEIAKAKPTKLLVIADGPREGKHGESEKVAAARSIINRVNWDCEVLTNYSDANLGCKLRVSSGIDWVFEQVEEAIILEDDCVPSVSFFQFCQLLLKKYRDDPRVMQISGSNFQDGTIRNDGSYYFSKYSHVWGWATWRRAWVHYDPAMRTFPEFKSQNQIQNIFHNKRVQQDWLKNLQSVFDSKIDTWDIQWVYSVWLQNGLSIIPNVNMITNIGFGVDATHTTIEDDLSNKLRFEIEGIIHPSFVLQCVTADDYTAQNHLTLSITNLILNKLKRIVKRLRV